MATTALHHISTSTVHTVLFYKNTLILLSIEHSAILHLLLVQPHTPILAVVVLLQVPPQILLQVLHQILLQVLHQILPQVPHLTHLVFVLLDVILHGLGMVFVILRAITRLAHLTKVTVVRKQFSSPLLLRHSQLQLRMKVLAQIKLLRLQQIKPLLTTTKNYR